MTNWVALYGLLALIFVLMLAPVFELKLDARTRKMAILAGLFLSVALMLHNASMVTANSDAVTATHVLGGIATGIGMFFIVVAAARLSGND